MDIKTILTTLLVLGVIITLFSLVSFFVGRLKQPLASTQKFKGFGVEFEITTVALTLLVGVLLTLPGFYLYIRDYQNQLSSVQADWKKKFDDLQIENASLRRQMDEGKRFEISAILQFRTGEVPNFSSLKNLQCSYSTWKHGDDSPVYLQDVEPGPSEGTLRVRIQDLERDDFIREIRVVDRTDNLQWAYRKLYNPAEPAFEMEKFSP
jgi:hypothetical protein